MPKPKNKYNVLPEEASEEMQSKERPHKLMKVPGIGNRAIWSRKIGRWIVPVIGGKVSDERQAELLT